MLRTGLAVAGQRSCRGLFGGGRWTGCWNTCSSVSCAAATFAFTTASGSVFHFRRRHRPAGRGAVHRPRPPQRGVLLDPELKLGECLHGRHAAGGGRHDRRPAGASCSARRADGMPPNWARPQWFAALPQPAAAAVQSARRARSAMSRITTTSTAGSTRCSSTPTGNTAAPISRRPTNRSTTPSSPRSATSPPSCCSRSRPTARPRYRLRLGRACALSRRILPRARHRHHAVARTVAARHRARRREGPGAARRIPAAGLSRHRRDASTASSRSACSSMSASATTTPSSANARTLLADDGVMLLHSIGRSEGPERHQPLDRQIHLPGRLHPGAVGGAAGDRARRACWSPTSKSCGCTTPRR